MQPAHIFEFEPTGGYERVDARPPQSLVGIDVPETGHRQLIEKRGLDRRSPPCKPPLQSGCSETGRERLLSDAGR
jgi:hypothetical protein